MFNIPTCTLLVPSAKICRLFLEINCQHKFLGFEDQCDFQLFMIFSFTNSKLVYIYIVLNHFHLNL
jgi:hypothetical protein